MNRINRIIVAISLATISLSAAAGIAPPTTVDGPPTLSLMGLGLVAAVLFARYLKR
jgi:hypothetical protein